MNDTGAVFASEHVPITVERDTALSVLLELSGPLALGQRVIISGPRGSGKTTILRALLETIVGAPQEIQPYLLLSGIRPEEATDLRMEYPGCETVVVDDQDPPEKRRELIDLWNHAQDHAASGLHAAVFVDSLTDFVHALNALSEENERILSGGIAVDALAEARRLFGMARTFRDGGSLTVVATLNTDEEREGDIVIWQEMRGTGSMDIVLEDPSGTGIFPLINLEASGARHDDLIIGAEESGRRARFRAILTDYEGNSGMHLLAEHAQKYGSLDELMKMAGL